MHADSPEIIKKLKTGRPKLTIVKFLGTFFFKGDQNIFRLQSAYKYTYSFIEKRHLSLIQCDGKYNKVKVIIKHLLEINILWRFLTKQFRCPV